MIPKPTTVLVFVFITQVEPETVSTCLNLVQRAMFAYELPAGGVQCRTDPVVSNATEELPLLPGAALLQTTRHPAHTGRSDLPPPGTLPHTRV